MIALVILSKTAVLAGMTGAGASTIWYRKRGRPSVRQKAITQQYLTPLEERALVNYLLRSDKNGYPLPVKFARTLAHIIAIRRTGVFASRDAYQELEDSIKPPGKNWPKAFHERWPELKAVRLVMTLTVTTPTTRLVSPPRANHMASNTVD